MTGGPTENQAVRDADEEFLVKLIWWMSFARACHIIRVLGHGVFGIRLQEKRRRSKRVLGERVLYSYYPVHSFLSRQNKNKTNKNNNNNSKQNKQTNNNNNNNNNNKEKKMFPPREELAWFSPGGLEHHVLEV